MRRLRFPRHHAPAPGGYGIVDIDLSGCERIEQIAIRSKAP
jgi:hypothetical protein